MFDPNFADLRGDGLDGEGHDIGREELADDMLGWSPFKAAKKAIRKVSALPQRITKPIARVVSKVPVIGRPAASGLRAAAQLANPLSVLRPKSFVKTQARAVTSPFRAVKALVKKPTPARKPPIAHRVRPSWAKPLAKPVARLAPRLVPKPVARPAPRTAPRPMVRPAPKPVARPVTAPRVAARPSWAAPEEEPRIARPAITPPRASPLRPAAPEPPPEPTFEEPLEQPEEQIEEQLYEEQPADAYAEAYTEEEPAEEAEEQPEEQPEEFSEAEPPAGWEEET